MTELLRGTSYSRLWKFNESPSYDTSYLNKFPPAGGDTEWRQLWHSHPHSCSAGRAVTCEVKFAFSIKSSEGRVIMMEPLLPAIEKWNWNIYARTEMFVVVEIVIRSVWSLYLSSSGTQSDNWSVCVHCNYLNSSPLSLPCYWLPPPPGARGQSLTQCADWQSVSPRKPQPVSHVCCACAGNNWDNIITISIAQFPVTPRTGSMKKQFYNKLTERFL